jgi:DNA-binding CsgD family transcriptional regulator
MGRTVTGRWIIAAILMVQAICAVFFVSDVLSSLIGFRSAPISWAYREYIEIGASVGLLMGLALGGYSLAVALRGRREAEDRLRRASGAFMGLLDERFIEWGLTPAERDVALFAIKGMSTAEIAVLRATSEGTVKAQTNAIYRKAGVTGRSQLLSLFIEDLMRDEGVLRPARVEPKTAA